MKKIKGTKISLNRIPGYGHNPLFTQAETKATDAKISKLPKKEVIKPCIHEQSEYISPIFVITKSDGGL